jgi:hypothetical protein
MRSFQSGMGFSDWEEYNKGNSEEVGFIDIEQLNSIFGRQKSDSVVWHIHYPAAICPVPKLPD